MNQVLPRECHWKCMLNKQRGCIEACLRGEFFPASTFHKGGCPLENVQVAERIDKSKSSTQKKIKKDVLLEQHAAAVFVWRSWVADLGLCSLLVHTAGVLSTASYGQDRPAILHSSEQGMAVPMTMVRSKVKFATVQDLHQIVAKKLLETSSVTGLTFYMLPCFKTNTVPHIHFN